ncbi:MAG: 50S ribosomal protein L22 [Patescibacteria group bacterium]|jgi:large subunit ribosomal protein L22
MNKATVYAKHSSARISPKKMGAVMNLVRGKDAFDAKALLALDDSKAARILLKTIQSAEANAKNNNNIDPVKMFIDDLQVNAGAIIKRGNFGARGRFSPILKRTSHIIVGLSERKQG